MPDGVNIPGGPSFVGNPQPPDVPCDPTGDGWRGPPGEPGPPGPPGPPSNFNMAGLPYSQPDGSPPVGAKSGDLYINGVVGMGGFVCYAP